MGYDAYSKVVFGVKVAKEDLTVEKKVRSCNHNTDLNANFCSVCGKPTYKVKKEMVIDYGYEPNEIGYFVSSPDSDEEGIVGMLLSQTGSQDTNYYDIPLPSKEMGKEIKEFLEANDFEVSDDDLRTYLYTEHSY